MGSVREGRNFLDGVDIAASPLHLRAGAKFFGEKKRSKVYNNIRAAAAADTSREREKKALFPDRERPKMCLGVAEIGLILLHFLLLTFLHPRPSKEGSVEEKICTFINRYKPNMTRMSSIHFPLFFAAAPGGGGTSSPLGHT